MTADPKPPCPWCKTSDDVGPLRRWVKEAWWCGTCNLVYSGTVEEWQAEQNRIQRRAADTEDARPQRDEAVAASLVEIRERLRNPRGAA